VERLHSRFGERSCSVICLVSSMKPLHSLFGWGYIRAEPFSFFVWFGSAPEQQQQQHHSGVGWTFY
jgi:hypothetical protein